MEPSRRGRLAFAWLGLVVGAALGCYVGYEFLGKPRQFYNALGPQFMASQYAYLQYREAGYPEAKSAMEAYVLLLDRPDYPEHLWLDARGRSSDKGLALARLALLEERAAKPEEASRRWAQAEQAMKSAGWKDSSQAHIRSIVMRLDADRPTTGSPTPVVRN
jgi:hypothetical protein